MSSNNRYQCVQSSHSPTDLYSSVQDPPPQIQSFKCNKPDPRQFYDNMIKDVMSGCSFGDSQNPEARRLHNKASLLAASALASTTKANNGKAWARFLYFCDKMGYDPLEGLGQDLATWLCSDLNSLPLQTC